MIKKKLLVCLFFTNIYAYSQVGIDTKNPQGIFHVDPSKNNPLQGSPSIAQSEDDFIIQYNGNVGVGTGNPTNKMHIKTSANPLKLEGVQIGNISSEKLLMIDSEGIVKSGTLQSASIPQPTVLTLSNDISSFLNGGNRGDTQVLTGLKITKNSIPGLAVNLNTSTITFPPGTYQINFVYEAFHDATNCTLSSYFVDFPSPDSSLRRIHTTASHNEGGASNHGGTITFVSNLSVSQNWDVRLGRGQSGNCDNNSGNSNGMTLHKNSTQILIFKIGD